MSPHIQILMPSVVLTMKQVYLRGLLEISALDRSIAVYFTAFSNDASNLKIPKSCNQKYIYGYHSKNHIKTPQSLKRSSNYLELKQDIYEGVEKLIIDSSIIDGPNDKSVLILYDYNAMKSSENLTVSSSYQDTFSKLHKTIQSEHNIGWVDGQSAFSTVFSKPRWLSSTMFGQHLLNYVDLINWIVACIKHDKKISIKQGNLLLALLIDIMLGYLVLEIFSDHKEYLSMHLMGFLEKLVNQLYTLLKWLMGAPAGLKLNNAFNKMLGKYFSYHIQLWWLFLDVSGDKLDIVLNTYHYLGYLGFTFQAAMLSDLICIATFHSYCIYVYAARLFNMQISGLIALMRLFVGRKFNPLRGGIDSCEYTNQELFVGTVAFTILIFLLPTTAMYYIVFTLFRLLSLTVQYLLAEIIYYIQTLPLYVTVLWIMKSPKVAGNVRIEILSNVETQPLVLKMKIFTKSFAYLLDSSRPPVEVQKPVQWTHLVSSLLRGKQIT